MPKLTRAAELTRSNHLLALRLLGTIRLIEQVTKEAKEQVTANKASDKKNYPAPYDQPKGE